jgi:uncharacterized membrane protein (DUF441 family)
MHVSYLHYLITNMITLCTLVLGFTVSNYQLTEAVASKIFSKITYILSCVPLPQVSEDGCVSLGITYFTMGTTSSRDSPIF